MPFWPFRRTPAEPELASSPPTQDARGITFAVDAVDPATEPLSPTPMHQVVSAALGGPIESCCDYTSQVVAPPSHPLVGAVHLAFSQHRPLVLNPDAIWLTIAQGLAQHVHTHSEALRDQLVAHAGKETIRITRDDFVVGSPENPWPEVFGAFSQEIQARSRADAYALMVPSFSTTGPVERAAYEVVLMDLYAPFFDYELACICGIPQVTLRGSVADWEDLAARVDRLDAFGLEHWTPHLRTICAELVRSARGDVDRRFWAGIYKPREQYGPKAITGWIALLFPYLTDARTGQPTRPNLMLTDERAREGGVTADALPKGLSQVPFRWTGLGGPRAMELVAGFFGVTQHDDLALEPKIGWAVREADPLAQVMLRAQEAGALRPPRPAAEVGEGLQAVTAMGIPKELQALYTTADGGTLGGAQLWPLDRLKRVCFDGERFVEVDPEQGTPMSSYEGTFVAWTVIGETADGACLAVDAGDRARGRRLLAYDPAALGGPTPAGVRVVADSLCDGLERLIAGEPLDGVTAWP